MSYLPAILASLLALVIITRPFTVLFHELGHALSALLLTGKGSTVFIGSYGETKQSFRVKTGRLSFWFRYNPFRWKGGLCVWNEEEMRPIHEAICILSGALFSLVLAAVLTFLSFYFDSHGALKLILVFMLGSTVLDLFGNLVPHQMTLSDGSILYSDGYLLINIKKRRQLKAEIIEAIELFRQKEYAKASPSFQHLLDSGIEHEHIYRFAYMSQMMNKEFERASSLLRQLEERYMLSPDDSYNAYYLSVQMQNRQQGQAYLEKTLLLDPNHPHALNATGYHLNQEGRFEEAIPFFDKAIGFDAQLAYAYNNRGHAYLELGQLDRGLGEIEHALQLDGENAYVYRNLGIYYLKLRQLPEARQHFLKAKEIDDKTEMIGALLMQTEAEISAS